MKAKRPKCCGVHMTAVKRVTRALASVGAIPDLEGHFNPSLGMYIGSRRELKDAQLATGSVDYEPSKAQKDRDAFARDKMKFEAGRR